MLEIEDDSIGCVFTSPPYALAKDYGSGEEDIGGSTDMNAYQEYLGKMKMVLGECYRVLKPGRVIGLNIADIYQTDKLGTIKQPIRFDMFNLMRDIGFIYCDVIQWKKPDGMATQKRYGLFMQNPYPLYYRPNNVYEPIIVMKKPGTRHTMTKEEKDNNVMNTEKYKEFQFDIWKIHPENHVDHPAPFPILLPKIFFDLHSLKGETVLDPFLGSGTSLIAAKASGKSAIGFEINNKFIKLAKFRVGFNQVELTNENEYIYKERAKALQKR